MSNLPNLEIGDFKVKFWSRSSVPRPGVVSKIPLESSNTSGTTLWTPGNHLESLRMPNFQNRKLTISKSNSDRDCTVLTSIPEGNRWDTICPMLEQESIWSNLYPCEIWTTGSKNSWRYVHSKSRVPGRRCSDKNPWNPPPPPVYWPYSLYLCKKPHGCYVTFHRRPFALAALS